MRRLLTLLALSGLALPLAAQSALSCSTTVPLSKTVRAEGKTELVGDVVVTCTGGAATPNGRAIPYVTFTLSFNATVTSKILGQSNASEVLALLDEPAAGAQYPCLQTSCSSVGNGTGSGYYGPPGLVSVGGNPNVFEMAAGGGTVSASLPVDPPGQGKNRIFRFTNIRMDASTAPGGVMRLTGISAGNVPIQLASGGLTVATAQTTLTASVRDGASSTAAANGVTVTVAPGGAQPTRLSTIRFSTGAARQRTYATPTSPDTAAAPVAQNVPGQSFNSETGFYNPNFGTTAYGSNLAFAGLADWGTRLVATFTNVPPNVTIYVSLRNDGATVFNAPAARLALTDANGEGAFTAIPGNGTYEQLTPNSGSAMAVWEVVRGSGASFNWDFGVYLSYPSGITSAPGPIGVKLSYAPRSGGAPIFADGATVPFASFVLQQAPVLTVSPPNLTFAGTVGGQNPPSQTIAITSTVATSYTLTGGGTLPFLFQPSTGSTPGATAVTIDTRGISAGTHTDVIRVVGPQSVVEVPVTLTIAPGPTISSLTPSTTNAGSPGFTLSVSGANFTQGTIVRWNTTPLTTTFGSAAQLSAQVPASLVANPGQASITAVTPDGAVSNTVGFTIGSLTLTAISPASVIAGGAAFTLTATGTGFQQGAVLNVGAIRLQAASVTATTLTATVPAPTIAQPGNLSVTVTNPDGLSTNALTLTVTEALTLTKISPDTVTATGPGFALNLTGTGFATGATVQIGSGTFTPSTVSGAQIAVNVPASAIAEPGALSVRVSNPDKQTSNALPLTVNPAPEITTLNPASAVAGAAAFTLTVTGTNLPNGSTVRWNGQSLSTTFVSATQLTAPIAAALVASPGEASVNVVTADGVSSNTLTFTIPAPLSITSLSPATANAGSGAFTLTVSGSNIPEGSSVNWGGQTLPTTFVSAAQVTAQVAAGLVASPGTAQITVVSRDGTVSNALTFRIVLPPLTNVGVTAPPSATSGQDQPITVTFTGTYPVDLRGTVTLTFTPDSGLPDDPAIQFQNGARATTFNVAAGAPAQVPAVVLKTGTVAGVITISATFVTAAGDNVTPAGLTPQRIQIGRAAPGISSVTCTRSPSGFTVIIDGFTNTREATQATFDFTASTGASLGTTQLTVSAGALFSGWFGSSAAATAGGVFRYTQPFNVQGSATNVAGVAARLTNSVGASESRSCQLQ